MYKNSQCLKDTITCLLVFPLFVFFTSQNLLQDIIT